MVRFRRWIKHVLIGGVIASLLLLVAPDTSNAFSSFRSRTAAAGASTPAAGTDYTADANCEFAALMNGGLSVNGDDETDVSANGNDLTEFSGDLPNDTDVPSGYSGTSRKDFSTNSARLYHADGLSTDITGTAITVAAWIKPATVINGAPTCVIGKADRGTSAFQYLLGPYGEGSTSQYSVYAQIGGTTQYKSTTTNYAVNAWHHIAVVYDGTDVRIYVDGSLDDSPVLKSASIGDTSIVFAIGQYANSGAWGRAFDGKIDEPGVWSRALSSSEINDLYTDGIDGTKGAND